MGELMQDVGGELAYYRLLEASEKGRWNFADLPWQKPADELLTPDLLKNVEVAAFGELTTFSATESFMKLFHDDVDFTQWLAVWFYEETKHPLAWIKYLNLCGIRTDANFIFRGRQIDPMTPSKVEMLVFNIISEITACTMYQHLGRTANEPLFSEIARNLARDEMRHSVGFEHYCRRTIENAEDPERERIRAFRATWFVMQPARDTQHPVFLTLRRLQGVDYRALEEKVSAQILGRMSRVLGEELGDVEGLYEAYAKAKRNLRSVKKSISVVLPNQAAATA